MDGMIVHLPMFAITLETLVKEKGRKIMKLFSDYSNRGQDQFGHLNPNLNDKKEYKYVVCMELEYPFVEKITCSKNNNK